MVTRSLRKAQIFCESNSKNNDMTVCVRVKSSDGKKHTYNCTPYQALNYMLFNCFIWFDYQPHI